jgi:propanediol dehydratase small subunit
VHFQEDKESLEDDPHPNQPVSTWPNENVEKAQAIVMQDRRITTTLLAECLGVSKKAARQILEKRFAEKADLFEVFAAL